MNTQERDIKEYLDSLRVIYKPIFTHSEHKTDWNGQEVDCFKIVVTNKLNGTTAGFDFYQGIGHRDKYKRIRSPSAASVLYSLLSDCQVNEYSFDDWCCNFGYDTDSKKAEKIFFACVANSKKLHTIFDNNQLEHIAELLEDY